MRIEGEVKVGDFVVTLDGDNWKIRDDGPYNSGGELIGGGSLHSLGEFRDLYRLVLTVAAAHPEWVDEP